MIIEEKLQIITERIREDIPRLMELSEGCYVKLADHIKTNNSEDVVKVIHYFPFKSEEISKIIGHEPMLNDVLEWIDITYEKGSMFLKYVMFQTSKRFLEIWFGDKIFAKWDLSKPYLKDQSIEFIEFLYNLIKE